MEITPRQRDKLIEIYYKWDQRLRDGVENLDKSLIKGALDELYGKGPPPKILYVSSPVAVQLAITLAGRGGFQRFEIQKDQNQNWSIPEKSIKSVLRYKRRRLCNSILTSQYRFTQRLSAGSEIRSMIAGVMRSNLDAIFRGELFQLPIFDSSKFRIDLKDINGHGHRLGLTAIQATGCIAPWFHYMAHDINSKIVHKKKLNPIASVAFSGASAWWLFKSRIAFICEPAKLYFDQSNPLIGQPYRLHRLDGPAVEWPDGIGLYYWRGVSVPEEWTREFPDVAMVLSHWNIEVRRAGCEVLGWDRVVEEIGGERIQRDDYGELWETKLPGIKSRWGMENTSPITARFLRVICPSSGRVYFNCVPPETETCREGLAWRFGVEPERYFLEKET